MKAVLTLIALLLTPLVAIHAADAPKPPATPGGAVTTTPVPRATVTERRLPDGDSELQLLDAQGKMLETAVVNLSRHHQPATAADDPLIAKWRSWKYGAFLCYNSNQFSGSEHCTIRDAKQYAPTDLNIRQWAQTLKAAGMQYAVLTTSHTNGFDNSPSCAVCSRHQTPGTTDNIHETALPVPLPDAHGSRFRAAELSPARHG